MWTYLLWYQFIGDVNGESNGLQKQKWREMLPKWRREKRVHWEKDLFTVNISFSQCDYNKGNK